MPRDTSESFIVRTVNRDLDFVVVVWLLYIQNSIMEGQSILLAEDTLKVQ